MAPPAKALATPAPPGCGPATDKKAVRRRGPGRVVLGSKPQLATTEKLVRWAPRADLPKTPRPSLVLGALFVLSPVLGFEQAFAEAEGDGGDFDQLVGLDEVH